MTTFSAFKKVSLAFACGAVIASTSLAAHRAQAAPQDYKFELAGAPTKSGKTTLITVRLVHVSDGKPVAGAVITQTRFDMEPEGMETMTGPAKATASADAGMYRIEAEPSTEGKWRLSLTARVQGEADAVRGSVIVPVAK